LNGHTNSPQFLAGRGNEYFCDIDEDYLTDRFNLTGLNTEVQYYQYALELVTDVLDIECDDEMREQIEKSARHLYGLVHARFIVTTRGLQKMVSRASSIRHAGAAGNANLVRVCVLQVEKYKKGEFGKCPRVMCAGQPLLPTGQHDLPLHGFVKLYCPRCEDLYNPKSSRHAAIDGAYFGTSFHSILFQVYPNLMPAKSLRRYEPRVFGFKVHAAAALMRWQDAKREEMQDRLDQAGVENGFVEEDEFEEEEDEEEDEVID
jgi:casein kinase II subunit beta